MSLPRKDVRFALDDDQHAALTVLADAAGLNINEWVEQEILRAINRDSQNAIVIAQRLEQIGFTRKTPELVGKARK